MDLQVGYSVTPWLLHILPPNFWASLLIQKGCSANKLSATPLAMWKMQRRWNNKFYLPSQGQAGCKGIRRSLRWGCCRFYKTYNFTFDNTLSIQNTVRQCCTCLTLKPAQKAASEGGSEGSMRIAICRPELWQRAYTWPLMLPFGCSTAQLRSRLETLQSAKRKALGKTYPYMFIFQGKIKEPSVFSCKDRPVYIPWNEIMKTEQAHM